MIKLKVPKIHLDQQPSMREKIFFALALGGLLLLFVNVAWTPQAEKIEKARTEMGNLRIERDGLKRLIDATKSQLRIQRDVPKGQTEVDEKVKRILARTVVDPLSEVHDVVGKITSRRFARGVKIEDVDVGEMSDSESYQMIPIAIDVVGRYGGILHFFQSLEKMERPLVVNRFTLKEGEEEGRIEGRVDVELYIIKR